MNGSFSNNLCITCTKKEERIFFSLSQIDTHMRNKTIIEESLERIAEVEMNVSMSMMNSLISDHNTVQ